MTRFVLKPIIVYLFLLVGFKSVLVVESYYEDRLETPTSEESEQLASLESKIAQMEETNFYNYHMMCAGHHKDTRVNYPDTLIHNSIPVKYHDFILETLEDSYARRNRCPKWTSNRHTSPESGDMDYLALEEHTPVGQVVYLISAVDPERKPLFYFLRKLEEDYGDCKRDVTEPIIFNVTTVKIGQNWYAEVRLNSQLDVGRKRVYCYVVNAFDGRNVIEKFSRIQVFRSSKGTTDYAHLYHGHDELDNKPTQNHTDPATTTGLVETVTKPNYENGGDNDHDYDDEDIHHHLDEHEFHSGKHSVAHEMAGASGLDYFIFYFKITISILAVLISWLVSYLVMFF